MTPPSQPCVGSGLCCKTAPCPYGEWDASRRQCRYLETSYQSDEITLYHCGRHDFISRQPGSEWVPAFGAGCCMALFNTERSRIIRLWKQDKDPELTRRLQARLSTPGSN